MLARQSIEHSHFNPRKVKAMDAKDYNPRSYTDVRALQAIGIGLDEDIVQEMANSKYLRKMMTAAMDAIQPLVTTASIQVPIQFLQNWLPGFVFVMTAPRVADE